MLLYGIWSHLWYVFAKLYFFSIYEIDQWSHFIIRRESLCLGLLVSIEILLLVSYSDVGFLVCFFKLTSLQNIGNKLHSQSIYHLCNQKTISSWLELNLLPCYVWSWYHPWLQFSVRPTTRSVHTSYWFYTLLLLKVYCENSCKWNSHSETSDHFLSSCRAVAQVHHWCE